MTCACGEDHALPKFSKGEVVESRYDSEAGALRRAEMRRWVVTSTYGAFSQTGVMVRVSLESDRSQRYALDADWFAGELGRRVPK